MKYYVNKTAQSGGEHEVHTEICTYLPNVSNKEYIGEFTNCKDAVDEAKKRNYNADGCYFCCYPCHKK